MYILSSFNLSVTGIALTVMSSIREKETRILVMESITMMSRFWRRGDSIGLNCFQPWILVYIYSQRIDCYITYYITLCHGYGLCLLITWNFLYRKVFIYSKYTQANEWFQILRYTIYTICQDLIRCTLFQFFFFWDANCPQVMHETGMLCMRKLAI